MRYFILMTFLYASVFNDSIASDLDIKISKTDPIMVPDKATTKQINIKKLIETRSCLNCDLRHADLSQFDLTGVNLLDSNLQYANLNHSQFGNAILIGVDFSYANMNSTQLKKAELHGANFYKAELINSDMQLKDILEHGAFSENPSNKTEKRPVFRGIRG